MEILFNVVGNIFLIICLIVICKWAIEEHENQRVDRYNENKMKKEKHWKEIELMETEIMNYRREMELKEEMKKLIKQKGEKHGRLHRSNRTCCRDNKACNTNRTNIIVK